MVRLYHMKQQKTNTFKILFSCLLFGFIITQKTEAQTPEIADKIDSLLTNLFKSGDFNGTALVVKGNNTIYEKSFGYSNPVEKDILKISDKFGVGSIYKELPAIAIMQLQEKGLLNVEDNISEHIPKLPEWSKTISIKNLFQYTSGLPKVNWGKHKKISDSTLLQDLIELQDLKFAPNEGYLYSNNNPFLLSQIIQNISGKDFTTYIQDNILKPIGLTKSVFKGTFPYGNRNNMALPFNDEFEEDTIPFEIHSPLFLFTMSAYDLYKLNHELHMFNIISENSLKTISEITTLDFENIQSPLGNVVITNDKIVEHSHHGSSGSYECLIRNDVQNDMTIVLFTNRKKRNVHEISEEIGKIILGN